MKFIMLAAVLCFLLTLQSAFALDKNDDGMKIAEELLLREDVSEELPAMEEKLDEKIKTPPSGQPVMAEQEESTGESASTESEDSTESLSENSAEMLANSLEPKPEPGTLTYEMATVDLLSDAAPSSADDTHEEIAKR